MGGGGGKTAIGIIWGGRRDEAKRLFSQQKGICFAAHSAAIPSTVNIPDNGEEAALIIEYSSAAQVREDNGREKFQ